ncbi:MAG: hypothetical protein IKF78_11000 [Atopobiaceae bacterium]|nr:hypothetical protein [Atopobiaceae bacterium]
MGKTGFVRDWWLAQDDVTLVCRPRRFGKTPNLHTVRCLLSTELAGRGEGLFGGTQSDNGPEIMCISLFVLYETTAWHSFQAIRGTVFS